MSEINELNVTELPRQYISCDEDHKNYLEKLKLI